MERGAWRDRSDAERTTLGDAFERYAREVALKKKSHRPELAKIQQWLGRKVSKTSLSRVGGPELAQVIQDMETEGKSPNTIRLHLAVLSHLYKVARTEWGMSTPVNPVELVRKPRLPQGRDPRLQGNEEARLLDACKQSHNPWLLPMVFLALETGMRAGELLSMEWRNVDLGKRLAILQETKNGTSRIVPLSSPAVETLRALPRSMDGRVFPTT